MASAPPRVDSGCRFRRNRGREVNADKSTIRTNCTCKLRKAAVRRISLNKYDWEEKNRDMGWYLYKISHLVENTFACLKHYRSIPHATTSPSATISVRFSGIRSGRSFESIVNTSYDRPYSGLITIVLIDIFNNLANNMNLKTYILSE